MPAQLSLASANVTGPDGLMASKAQVLIRGDVLKIGPDREVAGVQSATQVARGRWVVRFADASELTVERVGGCGCGGRR